MIRMLSKNFLFLWPCFHGMIARLIKCKVDEIFGAVEDCIFTTNMQLECALYFRSFVSFSWHLESSQIKIRLGIDNIYVVFKYQDYQ